MEQVQDMVARYRKDLAKPASSFNIWAFIFNSFYLLFGGAPLSGLFLFFGQAILLINIPLIKSLDADAQIILLLSIVFVIRLLNGFLGESYTRRMKAKFVAENEDADTNRIVNFVYVPLWRVALFSILSFGLYAIFWAYMQWKTIKRDTKYNVSPLGRAIFNGLFIWALIYRLQKNAPQPEKIPEPFFFIAYGAAAAYVASNVLSGPWWPMTIYLSLLAFIGFLFVQHVINKQVPHEYNARKMLVGELICVVLALGIFTAQVAKEYNNAAEQFANDQAITAANIGYFSMIGVRQQCIEYGYTEMQSPRIFADKYADSLEALDQTMRQRLNISLPQYWSGIDINSSDAQTAIGNILDEALKYLPDAPQDKTGAMRAACAAVDKKNAEEFQSEEFSQAWRGILQQAKVPQ